MACSWSWQYRTCLLSIEEILAILLNKVSMSKYRKRDRETIISVSKLTYYKVTAA